MSEDRLTGHIALVTGAAKRLGRATALALAGAGADVIVHYHTSVKEAGGVCDEIKGLGARAWMIQADLERPGEAEALIEKPSKRRRPAAAAASISSSITRPSSPPAFLGT